MRDEFAQVLTRERFCKEVGISPTTLRRWERARIVRPRMKRVMRIPTRVFAERDLEFGRRLIRLLRERPGEFSLPKAAAEVRKQLP